MADNRSILRSPFFILHFPFQIQTNTGSLALGLARMGRES